MAKSAKKVLSVFIAVLMIASMAVMAIPTASAASPSFSGGKIYWQLPDDWKNAAEIVYAHVYGHNGEVLYDWQTKNEKMTDEGNGIWSYEVPSGPYDLVTFSIQTGVQTCDVVLSDENIDDTAITDTSTMIENPVDSNKSCAKTTWKKTGKGVHLAITSIGNIVGEDLCPSEDGAEFVGNFIKNYYTSQPEYVTEQVLTDAMNKANTDGNAVVAFLEGLGDDEFKTDDKTKAQLIDEVKPLLGISGGGSDNNNNDNNTDNSNNNDNNNSNNTGGTTSNNSSKNNSSTGGTRTNSSTTSTTSSGTTTTGDSTPFVVLAIVLVASLGVAVVAAKKKVSE